MSRHHIQPPVIYTPPPKPKKIETRKRRIGVGIAGLIDDTDEAGETQRAAGFGPSTPASLKQPLPNFTAIEGAEQKPHHPRGRLSEGTLKAMLEVQELK
jgi:hypothetical protein